MKRKCTKCKNDKDCKEFYKTNKTIIGLSSWCKECTIKKAKEGYGEKKKYKENFFI